MLFWWSRGYHKTIDSYLILCRFVVLFYIWICLPFTHGLPLIALACLDSPCFLSVYNVCLLSLSYLFFSFICLSFYLIVYLHYLFAFIRVSSCLLSLLLPFYIHFSILITSRLTSFLFLFISVCSLSHPISLMIYIQQLLYIYSSFCTFHYDALLHYYSRPLHHSIPQACVPSYLA